MIVTSEEDKYGIKYRAEADWKVLGPKLQKNTPKIRAALPKLTSDQVKEFAKNREMMIDGIRIVEEDLTVVRYFEAENGHHETNTDKDVLILLNVNIYEELQEEGWAREVVNRVQRLRKKVRFQKWHRVLSPLSVM